MQTQGPEQISVWTETLLQKHGDFLMERCRRLCKTLRGASFDEADLFQEVCRKLLQTKAHWWRPALDMDAQCQMWLTKIARHTRRDLLRPAKKFKEHAGEYKWLVEARERQIGRNAEEKTLCQRIIHILHQECTPLQCRVFMLRNERRCAEEIKEITGISDRSISRRLKEVREIVTRALLRE